MVATDIGAVEAVACGTLKGHQLVAAATRGQGTQVWDLANGEPVGQPLDPSQIITAVACGTLNNGHAVVVTRREGDTKARAWDLDTGQHLWSNVECRNNVVTCATLNGRPVVVTPGDTYSEWFRVNLGVRIWDLATGEPIDAQQWQYRDKELGEMLACTMVDGHPVAVTKPNFEELRVWNLATGQPIGQHLRSRRLLGALEAVCTTLNRRMVAVATETNTHALLVWDLATAQPIGQPLNHTGNVLALVCTTLNGRPVAISGQVDGIVRVWDLARSRELSTHHLPDVTLDMTLRGERTRKTVRPIPKSIACSMDTIVVGYYADIAAIDYPGIGPAAGVSL